MSDLAEIQAKIDRIAAALTTQSVAVTNIAADIAAIKSSLPPAGAITQEELDALAAKLETVASNAEAVAAALTGLDAENPAP